MISLLTQLSWRKCARIDSEGQIRDPDQMSPCSRLLNQLLTIHAANSAHLKRRRAAEEGESGAMSINDLPALSVLRTKMQWHQERQRVLAENVSNSDTPNFKPRDLVEPKFDNTGTATGSMGALAMMRTTTSHI